jgi:hypothetical protein
MDSKQHIDNILATIRPIFDKAAQRIDALKPGEKIPATTLANDLAKEIGMTGPTLYPTLKFLFNGYPGVKVLKGAHGGIVKVTTNVSANVSASSNVEDLDSSVEDSSEE